MTSNIRNVNLNLLKVFDAVMEERSITRAANEVMCLAACYQQCTQQLARAIRQ